MYKIIYRTQNYHRRCCVTCVTYKARDDPGPDEGMFPAWHIQCAAQLVGMWKYIA